MARKSPERDYKKLLTTVIECLRDERDDLLKDVNGRIELIGGTRLTRYQELDSTINYLQHQHDNHTVEE